MKKQIIILLFLPTLLFSQNEDMVNSFIVVADSSHIYINLKEKMFDLKNKLNIEIDTLGRVYDQEKDLICLPENDEDVLFAGSYFIRRYHSELLSLEYLDYYDPKITKKTIGLVAGILGNKIEAEQLLKKVKKYAPNAFVINADIYMGCMH